MNALDYSLADFGDNNNPDVLAPPKEWDEWIQDPRVQFGFSFYEQQLRTAPRTATKMFNSRENKVIDVINLTSYNYLGLATHPEVIEAVIAAVKEYGMGASGSPRLSGHYDLHDNLSKKLAAYKQKEACMLYSSGMGGNIGAIAGLLRKNDEFILDSKCHRSLVDGGTLAKCKMRFFEHNNVESLAMMLEKGKGKRQLVAIEGVYSMEGDLPKIKEIAEVCEQYKAGLYLDEAHSALIFGKNGRGVAEQFGVEDKIGVSFGTMSKAFGGVGGYVISNENIIRYLKSYSSTYGFSCALPPPIVAGLTKSLELATRDSSLRDKLWENTKYFKDGLVRLKLDIMNTESQVIPIVIGPNGQKLYEMAAEVQKRGLFMQPVDFPAVEAHLRRFRISVSAALTKEQIDKALNIIEDVVVKGLKS